MLVEIMKDEYGVWNFTATDNLPYGVALVDGTTPVEVEAIPPQLEVINDKDKMKTLIKLKEAGFTAEEIIDLGNAELLWVL